jgi:hypothetical protein
VTRPSRGVRALAALALVSLGIIGPGAVVPGLRGPDLGPSSASAAPVVTGPRSDGDPTVAPGVQTGPDRLGLLGQTTTVGPKGTWEIHLQVGVRHPATAELRLQAYSRLTTRTDFDNSLRGRERGSVVWRTDYLPMSALPTDTGGGVTLSIPVNLEQTGDDLPRFDPVDQSGVFPLQVELYDGASTTVATLNTSIVFAAGTASQTDFPKLDVALTLGVHAPVVLPRSPAPKVTADAAAVAVTTGSGLSPAAVGALAAEVGVLRGHSGTPVDLQVTPQTVDALVATGSGGGGSGGGGSGSGGSAPARAVVSGLAALVAGGDQLLPTTYVATSLPSLEAAGLGSEIARQVSTGSTVLDAELHRVPGTSTWVVDGPLDATTLAVLAGLGATHLVLPSDDLSALPGSLQGTTFAAPTQLTTSSGRLTVEAADEGLLSHFTSGGDQVLAGQQLLAELAMIQLEAPAQQRGVAVLPPPSWTPDTAFLDTVLGGLHDNPLLQPVTATALFSGVAVKTLGGAPVARRLVSVRPVAAPLSSASAILEARSRLAGLQAVVPAAAPTAGELGRRLLLAESSDVGPGSRARLTSGVLAAIDSVRTSISLPGSTSITLTARKGSLPLSVLSTAPFHAHVELRLSSDKLIFEAFTPPGGTCTQPSSGTEVCQLLLASAINTVKVPVETRTSGVFTLQVTLSSPDGSLPLGSNRDTVRSTAVSGVGVVLIVLAFVGLAYWWIRNIRHGRRARQLIEPVDPNAAEAVVEGVMSPPPQSPAFLPPTTLPPTTLPPTTLPPTTLPPSTLPPSTLPPSTLPPTTLPPSTLPPATTPLLSPPLAAPSPDGPPPAVPPPATPVHAGAEVVDEDELFAEFFATPAPQYPLRRTPSPADPRSDPRRR